MRNESHAPRHASLLFELAYLLMRFNHVARFIVNANHGGEGPHPAHHSGVDNVFFVDKVEDSGLEFFGSDCEHSPVGGGGYRIGRGEEVDTAPREVPV